MSDPTAPRPPPIGMLALLLLGCLLYAATIGSISDLGSTDAAGRGLGEAFGVIYGFFLWIVLAAMVVIGGINGRMPAWGGIAASILVPASAVASVIAIEFIKYRTGWQLLVPALIPPLIAAYAFWARLPQLHQVLPPALTGIALWGGVLALTLAPMPDYVGQKIATARLQAAAKVENDAKAAAEEARRRDNLARFQQLTDASPLWEWAAFLGKDSELDKDAVAGARKLSHRQADAEAALQRGMGFPLVEYVRLDLQVTPGLCEGARDFLQQAATSHPSPGGDPYAAYDVIHQNFSPYLEAIEWLTAQDCDIEDAVARIAATAAAYPPSSSRDGFLGVLAWRRGNGFYERNLYDRALAAYDEAIRNIPRMSNSSTAAATSITTRRITIAPSPITTRRSASTNSIRRRSTAEPTPITGRATTTARSPTTTRRSASVPNSRSPTTIALRSIPSGVSIRGQSPISTRRCGSRRNSGWRCSIAAGQSSTAPIIPARWRI